MLILLLVIILPLLLIFTGIIPHRFRWYVLGLVFVTAVIVTAVSQETWFAIGIRSDTLLPAVIGYGFFAIAGYAAIRWYSFWFGLPKARDWKLDSHFRFLFIPISIAQQFVFMSFTLTRLVDLLAIGWLAIGISALVFALAHSSYGNWRAQLPLAFLGGIGFSALYYYFPNLIVASLAHMVLNLTAVYFGFFVTHTQPTSENQ